MRQACAPQSCIAIFTSLWARLTSPIKPKKAPGSSCSGACTSPAMGERIWSRTLIRAYTSYHAYHHAQRGNCRPFSQSRPARQLLERCQTLLWQTPMTSLQWHRVELQQGTAVAPAQPAALRICNSRAKSGLLLLPRIAFTSFSSRTQQEPVGLWKPRRMTEPHTLRK